ncbi:GNAT family N-acetyltransferase [Nocardia gipuzkoensis]
MESVPGTFGTTFEVASRWSEQQWRQWLHGRIMLVAETADGTVVGSVGGMIEDDLPVVVSMWVAPAHRGTGLSDRLLAALVDWAIAGRHHEIRLWVLDDNHAARSFYRRNGFTNTGERKRCTDWPDRYEIDISRLLAYGAPRPPDGFVAAWAARDAVRQVIDAELYLLDPAVRASPPALAGFLDPSFVEFGASGRRWDRDAIVAAAAAEPPTVGAATEIRGKLVSSDLAHFTYRRTRWQAVATQFAVAANRQWLAHVLPPGNAHCGRTSSGRNRSREWLMAGHPARAIHMDIPPLTRTGSHPASTCCRSLAPICRSEWCGRPSSRNIR